LIWAIKVPRRPAPLLGFVIGQMLTELRLLQKVDVVSYVFVRHASAESAGINQHRNLPFDDVCA